MAKSNPLLSIEPILETPGFGAIRIGKENVVTFPEGLVGFSDYKHYILLEHGEAKGVFYWLQSMDDVTLAFPVVDPTNFNKNYRIKISIPDLSSIEVSDADQAQVLAIATIPAGEEKKMWLNLQGPLVINKGKKLGKQIVLDGTQAPLRYQVQF